MIAKRFVLLQEDEIPEEVINATLDRRPGVVLSTVEKGGGNGYDPVLIIWIGGFEESESEHGD